MTSHWTIRKTHLFKILNTLVNWKYLHTWKHLLPKLNTNSFIHNKDIPTRNQVCLQLSTDSTLLRLYLEYLQYCTISHVLYCRVANAPFWTKVVVLWLPTLRCFSTFYGIYSKVQYIQYCKKEANQYSNISWLFFSIEWLEDLLGADANACSPNSRNLPLWTWSEQTMQSVSTSYSNKYLQIEKHSIT